MSVAEPGSPARLEFVKWGGKPHWRFEVMFLGNDAYGTWFGAPFGAVMQRGDEPPISWKSDFVVLVPQEGEWVATFNAEGGYPIYIDVTGPISIERTTVRAADLDLDVVRTREGDVRLLDEDEFAEHQLRYGYPTSLIAAARATATWLLSAVSADREPFADAPARWFDELRRLAG